MNRRNCCSAFAVALSSARRRARRGCLPALFHVEQTTPGVWGEPTVAHGPANPPLIWWDEPNPEAPTKPVSRETAEKPGMTCPFSGSFQGTAKHFERCLRAFPRRPRVPGPYETELENPPRAGYRITPAYPSTETAPCPTAAEPAASTRSTFSSAVLPLHSIDRH
jgi:hypothetical protein